MGRNKLNEIRFKVSTGVNRRNVIFLDVDGVIANTLEFLKKKNCGLKFDSDGNAVILPESISVLKCLTDLLEAVVVISSCWRIFPTDRHKLIDKLLEYGIPVMGITPRAASGRRDEEIYKYLTDNRIPSKRILILDDSSTDLEKYKDRHYRVNPETGLVPEDICHACAVFSGTEESRLLSWDKINMAINHLVDLAPATQTTDVTMRYCLALALMHYHGPDTADSRSELHEVKLSVFNWLSLEHFFGLDVSPDK